jgi:hypothetical protein
MRPACRYPHGDARLLQRRWVKFTAPERGQPLETAIEQPSSFTRVDDLPERLELVVAIAAEPDPEGQPPPTEMVERHRFPGQLVHASPRERGDHRPEPQLLRRAGDGGQRHPRVCDGSNGCPIRDVVPQEESVPAARFRAAREFGQRPRIYQLVERCEEDPTLQAHAITLPAQADPAAATAVRGKRARRQSLRRDRL